MTEQKTADIVCSLCGFKFKSCAQSCDSTCPFNRHCQVLRCPHCGYQMIDDSSIREYFNRMRRSFRWLKRMVKKKS